MTASYLLKMVCAITLKLIPIFLRMYTLRNIYHRMPSYSSDICMCGIHRSEHFAVRRREIHQSEHFAEHRHGILRLEHFAEHRRGIHLQE